MSGRSRVKVFVVLAIAVAIIAAPAAAQTPEGVSPGAVDWIAEVEGRCPTFIWGGVSGAQAFELVVYRLPDETQASDTEEIDLSRSEEVLYSRVPGGATAWQPGLAQSLEPGGCYVWFVRAVFQEEAEEIVEAGDWSAGRFFSIPAMPSAMEVEEALSVLRRFTDFEGAEATELDRSVSQDRSEGSTRSASGRSSAPLPESLKSVPIATAAIKGTVPDATGETYGVVGISNSPDGAGVGAANTAGGPDLVLDGSENFLPDAELSESGIDGAFFATDAEAAGLVAAHAVSADHDGRYYTETELSTSGGGGAVNWDNLTAVPPGFADGVDDNTTYSFGYGLVLVNGVVSIDPTFLLTRISTLDSVGDVGHYTSIAIGADGLGLISYYDQTNTDLKAAHLGVGVP